MILKCMVVDDDAVSRNIIKHYIKKTDFLSLNYEFSNAIDAAAALQVEDVDIIFLDIEMPHMSGLELVKTLDNAFEIILITTDANYAVEAFDNSVTDYLLKPVEYHRFFKAVSKSQKNIELFRKKHDNQTDIFVKSDYRLVKIKLSNILFIEALADYIIINTEKQKYIVHSTMKGIEKRLPHESFSRIHRSYLVNTEKIDSLEDLSVVIHDKSIPIGASYKENFLKRLNFL
ncbi:LytTR family DNA-binding domain-containing protein [soil metagenome]